LAGDQRIGLATNDAGDLILEAAPGPADGNPIELAGPYEVAVSGIAVAPCGDIVMVDGDAARIVVELACGDRAMPHEEAELNMRLFADKVSSIRRKKPSASTAPTTG
jgi:hypothetical protein